MGCVSRAYLKNHKEYGDIGVYSEPARASILVDGNFVVKTPAIIGNVFKNKPYKLEVTREGYEPWTEMITLTESRRNLKVRLIKK